jgi:hypothetical protein
VSDGIGFPVPDHNQEPIPTCYRQPEQPFGLGRAPGGTYEEPHYTSRPIWWTEAWDIVGTLNKPLEPEMYFAVLPAKDHDAVICSMRMTREEEIYGEIVVHAPSEDHNNLISAVAAAAWTDSHITSTRAEMAGVPRIELERVALVRVHPDTRSRFTSKMKICTI